MKKRISIFLAALSLITLVGCNKSVSDNNGEAAGQKSEAQVPELSISWGNELHTGIMNVPVKKVEEFKSQGVYLNPLSADKFELIENDKKLAVLNFIASKGGSETANLMSQNHLDYGFCSNTAILSAVDNGSAVKIISPMQSNGIALVFPPNTNLKSWKDIKEHIQKSDVPIKIGYHSPVSGPRIVIESVLNKEGLVVSENPNDINADVVLVDLKGSNNLLPALSSKQVDAWVGPSHHPEAAQDTNVGQIALTLKDFPPVGAWDDFPCCVMAARQEVIDKYPEITKALIKLVKLNTEYCNENRDDVAKVMSEIIGVSENAIKLSEIKYFTAPSDKWMDGIKVYVDALNEMGKFSGELKGQDFEVVKDKTFEFKFLE
ncbi:MAG: ABC transporter substrate-binding protein [Clostridium sp.]|uniref:ABC transporter substrate-binding protein n=1 Tax=Clostridium sp. TaxID=1506 RepID=UPI0030631E08